MREIRFRAWHIAAQSMLYDTDPGDCLRWKNEGQPLRVMQFTGLHANGKEVYEGDILGRNLYSGVRETILIEWFQDGCCFGYKLRLYDHIPLTEEKAGWMEIIGNRFESPELVAKPLLRGQERQK